MPRKGTATVKTPNKNDKYKTVDSDSNEISPDSTLCDSPRISRAITPDSESEVSGQVNQADFTGKTGALPELVSAPAEVPEPERQPRQAPPIVLVQQSKALAHALFPPDHDDEKFASAARLDLPRHPPPQPSTRRPSIRSKQRSAQEPRPRRQPSATPHPYATSQYSASVKTSGTGQALEEGEKATKPTARSKKRRANRSPPRSEATPVADMASGGSYIPPGQQRNMRACMVCSIVRTHQQFLQQGCPNCEDILELVGNPEQINDCTSQVFEGLITVADTKRSWVARYQRLEGYVPGVYATQVEGILPEDVIGAVENAGINYVPRDGSEQEMLPKD